MRYQEKIPNGKMIAVEVEAAEGTTTRVKITGDFFLYPEEKIEDVERSLTGISVDTDEWELAHMISDALGSAELIGATAEDLARIFKKAVS